ncbi:30S ribosomal protein S7, partial [Candidatus Curtissbacteria bacterium]|nr:30S ribosomal protein S7 [Candidatus Curtissbacteria bacterium]
MPRTGRIERRQIPQDPIYNHPLVAKLVNKILVDGKKALAQKIVYGAFDEI